MGKGARAAASERCRGIFDGGANHGYTTRKFLAEYPAAVVYAFEPDPITFGDLTVRFSAEGRVRLVNHALSSEAGVSRFHRGVDDTTSSFYPRNQSGRRYYRSHLVMKEEISVSTTTLDDFCSRNQISRVNLLKLDLQGGEYRALSGATRLLSNQVIDVIISEFFVVPHYEGAPLLNEIWSLLRRHDYDLYDLLLCQYGRNGQARWGDAVFVSRAHRERRLDAAPEER